MDEAVRRFRRGGGARTDRAISRSSAYHDTIYHLPSPPLRHTPCIRIIHHHTRIRGRRIDVITARLSLPLGSAAITSNTRLCRTAQPIRIWIGNVA